VNAKGPYLLLYLIAHRTIITLSTLYCGELELEFRHINMFEVIKPILLNTFVLIFKISGFSGVFIQRLWSQCKHMMLAIQSVLPSNH